MNFSRLFSETIDLPFSFIYNGVSSREFLDGWNRCESTSVDTRNRRVRSITFTDPETRLRVVCDVIAYDEHPAVDWVLYFQNDGSVDTPIIKDIRALDLAFDAPSQGDIVLHHSKGSTCTVDDFLPVDELVRPNGAIELAPVLGRSSDGNLPFFNLEWDGGGLTGAIGWTGQWSFGVSRDEDRELSLLAGQQFTHMKLHPGEMIRSPRMLLLNWYGSDRMSGHNLLRRLIIKYYTPMIDGKPAVPPITTNTWFTYDTGNGVNEENQLEIITRADDIGVECYWLDAGWFEGGWPDGAGNWVPRKDGFPNGLAPLGDDAHRRGMKFVLWFEPERVTPNSRIAKEHPEWVLHVGSYDRAKCEQDLSQNELFNLGIPEAREWLTDILSDVIRDGGVDVYRQDFNIFGTLFFWEAADTPDRVGMTENLHVQGLYAMWDDLLRRHPGLTIDNCASGGRRIDLEMISRSYPLWRSDTQCCGHAVPVQDQVQTAGLSLYVPLHSAGVWDFDPYTWRSVATTGVNLCMDIRDTKYKRKQIKKMIKEVKDLRKSYLCDYYPLTEIGMDESKWIAWQFDCPESGSGFAVFFRRAKSGYTVYRASLGGVDPDAVYEVILTDEGIRKKMKGSKLASINVKINSMPGSALITYTKL